MSHGPVVPIEVQVQAVVPTALASQSADIRPAVAVRLEGTRKTSGDVVAVAIILLTAIPIYLSQRFGGEESGASAR